MEPPRGDLPFGSLAGMRISLTPPFFAGTIVLAVVFYLLAFLVFRQPPLAAIVGTLVLVVGHWVNETLHNLSHFLAARRTGHPMLAVRLGSPFLIFGTSVYPEGEGELPASVHLRRAVGGPVGNSILALFGAVVTAVVYASWPAAAWVGLVWTLENLLVFSAGNLLPLGFNDGSTMLRWVRQR